MECELMAGNSSRRGAVKKSAKGNPTAGSGGRRRKGLEGKGPTPKAEDRPYHKQHKMARAADRRAASRPKRKPTDSGPEWVAGRNAVAELLQANVPVSAIHVAEDVRRDERVAEIFRLASERHVALLEVPKSELDKFTGAAVHQGVAAKLEAYEYAQPDELLAEAAERGEPPLIVMLDGVTDPRNLGAVIRSAAGFGAHGVVIGERRTASMTASAWKVRISKRAAP
jgi:23S rRNA (guanosine2251-2'-O)-methyltransferase